MRGRRPGAAVASARGGGLWGDGVGGANARSMMNARDPRARRGFAQAEEEEESSGAAAFGKALVAIILALVIGAGAAYGYYIYSTPKLPANVGQPSSTSGSGSLGAPYAGHAAAHTQPPTVESAAHTIAYITLGDARQV